MVGYPNVDDINHGGAAEDWEVEVEVVGVNIPCKSPVPEGAELHSRDHVIAVLKTNAPGARNGGTSDVRAAAQRKCGQLHPVTQASLGIALEPCQSAPPLWVPRVCPGWAQALPAFRLMPKSDSPPQHLFSLPPPHLFYAEGQLTGVRMHNWLRIRMYCIAHVLNPPADGKVLMTTTQWRIALEGKYCAIPYQALVVKPVSTPEDIAKLPSSPLLSEERQRTLHREQDGSTAVTSAEKRRQKQIADRIDIATSLYPSGKLLRLTCHSRHRSRLVDEVVWELAIMNFRLELLDIDRDLLASLYGDEDMSAAADRQLELLRIWHGEGSLHPMYERDTCADELGAEDWQIRREAHIRWARALQSWPRVDLAWRDEDLQDRRAYDAFEAHVVDVYCRSFYEWVSYFAAGVLIIAGASCCTHSSWRGVGPTSVQPRLTWPKSMAPQNEEQRARLLKAARNKRYYEKKKVTANDGAYSIDPRGDARCYHFAISSPPPSSGSPPPTRMHLIDRLPILGRPFLPDEIPWLHTLLETWGYYNDLPKFVEDFHTIIITRGRTQARSRHGAWKGLTEVVFRIQWIMTAADVRLHAAEVGHPLSDTGVAEIIEDEALEIED
ncbi:hypothetical protein A0H81_14378 [Grifola frondosa]|uniref:Uncharacterized protein n=1 Tax=Grifola frondosa TaxID=5627 RepID=A0A1C7LMB8_GRIFR|nr:hypothetical protein A0H81_14378 [Grifola frondosa]